MGSRRMRFRLMRTSLMTSDMRAGLMRSHLMSTCLMRVDHEDLSDDDANAGKMSRPMAGEYIATLRASCGTDSRDLHCTTSELHRIILSLHRICTDIGSRQPHRCKFTN